MSQRSRRKNFPVTFNINQLGVILLSSCVFVVLCSAAPAQDISQSINTRIERLESRYGIRFRYQGFRGVPDFLKFSEAAAPDDYRKLNKYLALFEEEINKYPPGFFENQGVRGIGMVTHLFLRERPAQGLYSPKIRVMFFDISRFSRNKAQQIHNIHHEIFHMMVEIKSGFAPLGGEAWASLNDPGFSYSGGRPIRISGHNPHNYYAPRKPGFVTYYAMEAANEDQAEIFACLMQDKHRQLIEQWIEEDKILRKKVEVIKSFARSFGNLF